MTVRHMYKRHRYNCFLGLQVTREMNEELEREATHALQRKSEFIRLMLEEGLKAWRFGRLRIVKDGT
jgi:hypothetical protein